CLWEQFSQLSVFFYTMHCDLFSNAFLLPYTYRLRRPIWKNGVINKIFKKIFKFIKRQFTGALAGAESAFHTYRRTRTKPRPPVCGSKGKVSQSSSSSSPSLSSL